MTAREQFETWWATVDTDESHRRAMNQGTVESYALFMRMARVFAEAAWMAAPEWANQQQPGAAWEQQPTCPGDACTQCGGSGEWTSGSNLLMPCDYCHGTGKEPAPPAAMTDQEKEEQRRSFAYGNANLHNPSVAREMVNEVAAPEPGKSRGEEVAEKMVAVAKGSDQKHDAIGISPHDTDNQFVHVWPDGSDLARDYVGTLRKWIAAAVDAKCAAAAGEARRDERRLIRGGLAALGFDDWKRWNRCLSSIDAAAAPAGEGSKT